MEITAESPQSSAGKVSREVDISDRSLKRMLTAVNPNAEISQELNVPGVPVWAGIWSGGVFYNGTLNAENYLEILYEVLLELQTVPILKSCADVRLFGSKTEHIRTTALKCSSLIFK